MKILVTGGAGFIGSHVVEHFVSNKKNTETTVFDNLSRIEILGKASADPLYNWNYLKTNYPTVKLVKGDVRNFEDLKKAAEGSSLIVHTAAQVAVTTSLIDHRTDFEINALGTLNALEVARLNDAAVIYTSTNKVYGENVNKIPVEANEIRYLFADRQYTKGISEDFPIDLSGHSPYGCSKLAGDLYVQDYAHTYGLKTAVFRMSCIYGERQFGVEDQGWLAWFVIATLTNQPISIYGDGKQVRDVLYVSDLVEAFASFIDNESKSNVFNMGGGPENSLSLLEALSLIEKAIGKKIPLVFKPWRSADQKVYLSDIAKAKKTLSWKPRTSPHAGIKKLFDWISTNIGLLK